MQIKVMKDCQVIQNAQQFHTAQEKARYDTKTKS